MNFYINQSICIQTLRIGSVTNSSVLQIGSAGAINSLSTLANTGGYTSPAPESAGGSGNQDLAPAVPLTSPV